MSIGKRLKELRINSGLTQSEVAKNIGVAIQTIFKYENEIVTNIPSDKIEKLAKVFDTTPEYIMGWKSDNKSENKPDNVELEEDVIMYHRDGKTVRKKMTKEQIKMLAAMIDALPEDDNPDL